MFAESCLGELFSQIFAGHDRRHCVLVRLSLVYRSLKVHLKLGVLLGVVAEEKCFCWLDCAAKPSTEVTVADPSFQALCVQLNQNFKQGEVKVLLLRGAKVLG